MRAEFSLDYDVLTVERPQKLYLMARFVSGSAPGDEQRRPLNLSLVIDQSGSMAGDKLDFTRQAAQFLVQNLGQRDLLSIVLYNNRVETLLPPEPVHRKDAIMHMLAGLQASGTTNLSGGWLEGCKHVAAHRSDQRLNRVILMSDGLANRGVVDSPRLVTMAQRKRDEGVSTTTMGLGQDFNEDLLMAMATAGGGAFYFIESPEVAPLIFGEELQGLLNLVGQNLNITVVPTQHVTGISQLNAYPMHSNGRDVTFGLGDVFGDEVKVLILELAIPALSQLGQMQIATLRFSYDELTGGGVEHRTWEMPVRVNVAAQGEPTKPADPEVLHSVLLLRSARARGEAVKAADSGDYSGASQILRQAARAIADAHVQDQKLTEEYDALVQQANEIERGGERYSSYSRKTMSTQAFYTMGGRHEDTVLLRHRERQRDAEPPADPARVTQEQPLPPATLPEVPPLPRRPGVTPTHATWKDRTFELKGDLIRIGRAVQNEILLQAHGVSRFHAQIKRDGDRLLLEDLGSTNGTVVEGVFISSPHALSVGDVVFVCNEKLIFHDGSLS